MKSITRPIQTASLSRWGSWRVLLVSVLMMAMGSQAQAAPLNLTLLNTPDIVSTDISVNYTAGSGSFTASGFALALDDDGSVPAEDIAGGTFNISATIDSTGALQSGGALSIGGTVASLNFLSGTLLTGNLTEFGFPDSGRNPLEFLFTVTGGDAAGLYGGSGATGGIILSSISDPTGDWDFTADFTGDGFAVSDVAPIPVPAAVWLFGSGLLGLAGFGRRRA